MERRILTIAAFGMLGACVQPIKRENPVAANPLAGVTVSDAPKKRLWVLPFVQKDRPVPPEFKELNAKQLFQKALVKAVSKPVSPFLPEVAEDNGLLEASVDSSTPAESLQKIARQAGVGGFLKGTITDLKFEDRGGREGLLRSSTQELTLSVEYELFDAMSGRKLFSGSAYETLTETKSQFFVGSDGIDDPRGKLDLLTTNLAEKVLAKLITVADKIGWQGRVVRLDGSRIFLNAGRRTGMQVGDVVRVIDQARPVVDPQNGQVVGEAPGRLKATLKITQHFGTDGAIAVLLSGGGVTPGDIVELN